MSRQIQFNLDHELIVDCFAGGGGVSMGLEAALGRPVDVAINHNAEAIAMHERNHPATRHYIEDIWKVDPLEATGGRPVGLAHFSPDCTHFSKARGGKPVKKQIRGLAWVVLRWAAAVRPRIITMENVEEFTTWGPLQDGLPCPKRKGRTFRKWMNQLRALGYAVEWRVLRACDYGAPTIRKRLFVVARCDGAPIVWPEPTHAAPERARALGLLPYRTAAECIDWSIPCPSIFTRKRPLQEATLRRIANGLRRYVLEAKQPFIVRMGHYSNITGDGAAFRGQPLTRPLGTVTSGANDKALVVPALVPITHHGDDRVDAADKPMRTITSAHRGEIGLMSASLMVNNTDHPGGKVDDPAKTITSRGQQYLVGAFLAKHFGGVVGQQVDRPASTVTAVDHHSLVTSHLLPLHGSTRDGRPADEPAPAVLAQGNHLAEVRAFLVKYFGTATGQAVDDPMHTLTAKARLGLVTVEGADYQIVDIGMRMLTPRELFLAQGFPARYVIDFPFNGKPLTKTAQIRLCGNSVCPPVIEALVRANYGQRAQAGAA